MRNINGLNLKIVERKSWTSGITDGGTVSLSGSYDLDKHIILPESYSTNEFRSGMNLYFSSDNTISTYRSGSGAGLYSLAVAIAKVKKAIRRRASVNLTLDNTYRTHDFDMGIAAPTDDTSMLIGLVHNIGRFGWLISGDTPW